MAGFAEHALKRPGRPTGYRVAAASVHLVTVSHFREDDFGNETNTRHEDKKNVWMGEIADRMATDYSTHDSHMIGGDLNIHRCARKGAGAGDYPENQTCVERAWWLTLNNAKGYLDTILELHRNDDNTGDRIVPQYRDGWSSGSVSYRTKRIDYIFSRSARLLRGSFDLTCGESARGKIEKNCRDVRNPEFYSDHRLLWTLVRDA